MKNIKVELLHHTPLVVADKAIGKCWDKQGSKINLDRMDRVINKNKHESTAEHLVYNFDIDGISRACLQELARHRISSFSVKSSRYTLNELKGVEFNEDSCNKYIVSLGNPIVDEGLRKQFKNLIDIVNNGGSLDEIKYAMPEAYRTSLVWTINARSLRNFLELRTSKAALKEIRILAYKVLDAIPEEHKFLFEGKINGTV